jgi:hypothetical protein
MLDPLRSLAELVRTLTRTRTERRDDPAQRLRHESGRPVAPNRAEALRERLRQRLQMVGTRDPRAAREAFVETVLAAELGDALTLDPAMGEIVRKVSHQLGSDAAIERELNKLLEDLARPSR